MKISILMDNNISFALDGLSGEIGTGSVMEC